MEIIIKLGYLFGTIIVGLFLYYWSSSFKKLGEFSLEEMNEGEMKESEILNESEGKLINKLGTITFIILGFFIWTYFSITIGKIASDITNHFILKWFCYIFIYFIFLRIPFGVGNKMVKNSYDFERFPEKNIFSVTMICFYVLSICCYDWIPKLFKWHLVFLN